MECAICHTRFGVHKRGRETNLLLNAVQLTQDDEMIEGGDSKSRPTSSVPEKPTKHARKR